MKDLTVKEYREIQRMGPGPDLDKVVAMCLFDWRELTDDEWEIAKAAIYRYGGPNAFLTADAMPRLMVMPYEFRHGASKLDFMLQPLAPYSTDAMCANSIIELFEKDGWRTTISREEENASVMFTKKDVTRAGRGDASSLAWAIVRAGLSTLVANWADGTDIPEYIPEEPKAGGDE